MILKGDYHTHTTYSHGTGSIEDNVKIAEQKGLTDLAITDHGFAQMAVGIKKKKLAKMRKEINELNKKYKVNVLLGIETNIVSSEGHIDLKPKQEEMLDVVACGFHKLVKPKSFSQFFKFTIPAYIGFFWTSKRRVRKNTEVYKKLLRRNRIDFITHLNVGYKVNVLEVAKEAILTNTAIELNGKRINFSDKEMKKMIGMGVKFVLSSDAHSPERVGDISKGMSFVLKYKIPESQILNINNALKLKKHK